MRKLVGSAAVQFDRKGYAHATLEDVSRTAGVTKGALYFHFSSKDELADAVQARGVEMLADLIDELRAQGQPSLQALIDATHVLARWIREEPTVRASFRITRELVGRTPPTVDFHLAWVAAAWNLLRLAGDEKDLRPDIAESSAEMLIAAVTFAVEGVSWTGMSYAEASQRLTGMWDLVLPTLVPEERVTKFRTSAPEPWMQSIGRSLARGA